MTRRVRMVGGLALLLAAVAAVSCTSSDGSDPAQGSGDESREPTPTELAEQASEAMAEVETAAFEIEQTGAEIFLDDAELVAFQSAEGHFASPSSAEAVIAVEVSGFLTEVGAVAIDGDLWMTDPLSGTWGEAPEQFAFDPSTLFHPDEGLAALLSDGAATAELVEDDSAEAEGRTHLRMEVPAERVAAITSGLISADTEVDVLIDPGTGRLEELRFDTPVDGDTSSWRLLLSDYDEEVSIEPPELAGS